MNERAGRWVYALEALAIGLPTLALSIPVLLVGFMGVLLIAGHAASEPSKWWGGLQFEDVAHGALVVTLVAGGIAGVMGWFVLSGHYLMDGRKGLQEAEVGWWVALAVGIGAAVLFLVMVGWKEIASFRLRWFFGPALVLPAMHLVFLRFRSQR